MTAPGSAASDQYYHPSRIMSSSSTGVDIPPGLNIHFQQAFNTVMKSQYESEYDSFLISCTGVTLRQSMIILLIQDYRNYPKDYPGILEDRTRWDNFVTKGVNALLDAWAEDSSTGLINWKRGKQENRKDNLKGVNDEKKAEVEYLIRWRHFHARKFFRRYRSETAAGLVNELKPKLL
ncbi:MAG: hypothetical protein Q9212_002876 [Teloschistes hypoglaucus]